MKSWSLTLRLFVVGAGSLIRKDGRTHFDHMMEKGVQPPTSKPALPLAMR